MFKKIAALGVLAMSTSSAFAYTECSAKVTNMDAATDASMWVAFDRAPSTAFSQATAAGFKYIYAAALASIINDKTVTVRYAADGVPCNSSAASRSDAQLIWISR